MANLGANDFARDLELNDLDIDLGCDPPISPSKDKNYSEADKIESKMNNFDFFGGLLPDIQGIPEDDVHS